MVVEDSDTERRLLAGVIAQAPRLTLAAAVASGEAALERIERVQPDVVTMDVNLPGLDGIETTKEIMRRHPVPVVIVAAGAGRAGRLHFEALRAGALAIVEKPRIPSTLAAAPVARRLQRHLIAMSEVKVVRRRDRPDDAPARIAFVAAPPCAAGLDAVGLAASTGGPGALIEVLGGLGPAFPAPVLIVQHIGEAFSPEFVAWLDEVTPMAVRPAVEGEMPRAGCAYVAPPGAHLELAGGRLKISGGPPVHGHRPSANVLFHAMANAFGARCAGVVLTGMGQDGAVGLKAIRDAGGLTIAEDHSTAVVYGMPAAAVALHAAAESHALPEIAPRLWRLASLVEAAHS